MLSYGRSNRLGRGITIHLPIALPSFTPSNTDPISMLWGACPIYPRAPSIEGRANGRQELLPLTKGNAGHKNTLNAGRVGNRKHLWVRIGMALWVWWKGVEGPGRGVAHEGGRQEGIG
jgi:hypothetical protein